MQAAKKETANIVTEKIRVLLVDDNKVNQFLGKRILNNLGIENVDLASGGEEALRLMAVQAYDIVLTDVEMPGMNGYMLSQHIRNLKNLQNRPVIVALTANASDEDRITAKEAGIDDYLTKPYSPQDLLDVIVKHVHAEGDTALVESSQDTANGIEKLYAVFNHNTGDVTHFLLMLQQQLPELIREVRVGLGRGEMEKAYHAAHKLKSPLKLLLEAAVADRFGLFTENLRNRSTDAADPESEFSIFDAQFTRLLQDIEQELRKLRDKHP